MMYAAPTPSLTTARRKLITVAVALLLALAAAWVLRPSASNAVTPAATTDAPASPLAPKPTVVLVHGAFADSGGWDATVAQLTDDGFPVIAATDPLRGLTSDADYVRALLSTIDGPIVLVGHSYGGAVITNAARGVPNVKALVYVGAFVPDAGESIATAADPAKYPGSLLGPDTITARPVPNPSAPGGQDTDLYISLKDFRAVFAGDVSQRRASVMARTQRPLSATANFEPSGQPAWKTIPSWDLITLDDMAIAPAGQRFMATRAGAHVSTVSSAHDVMVSHPGAVTTVVESAARAIS